MKKYILIAIVFVCLAGCENSNPDRKKIEEVAKRNPLDMANEDSKTIVLKSEKQKPKYPKVPTSNPKTAPYVCAKNSKVYHVRGCEYAGKMDSPVGYESWQDAERAGRMPCEFCKPRENAGAQTANVDK